MKDYFYTTDKYIMNKRLKLIWDFKGSVAEKTAEHHCIHLREFAEREHLQFYDISSRTLNEFHSIAFIIVDEAEMPIYRDALKPHRGQLVE